MSLACAAEVPEAKSEPLSATRITEIRERIESLKVRQADYLRKTARGEIKPQEDTRKQWPQIQKQVGELGEMINSLNTLDLDSPERSGLETKLLVGLLQIGMHLESASHPDFTPRVLDAADLSEMRRIEDAIAGMKFGDRKTAKPVKTLGPEYPFTLIHLPVPIVLQCLPQERVFLAATTGGAFHNGLSLIELKADEQGIARTSWVSTGDGVADCHITIHSQAAIESQELRIRVVSPSLPPIEGMPQKGHLKGEIPRLKSKLTILKSRVAPIAD